MPEALPDLARRPGQSVRVRVTEHTGAEGRERPDRVATEEPLEIRITADGMPPRRAWVTMRTPGHDFDLAAGFCVHEGVAAASGTSGIRRLAYCTDNDLAPEQQFNVVTVTLEDSAATEALGSREQHLAHSMGSSACGVCGKESIEAALTVPRGLVAERTEPDPMLVRSLPDLLRDKQTLFGRTGGVHGAALVDAQGRVLVAREDVGRHNAVDKVTGARVLGMESPAAPYLVVSGRAGFELVQKAVTSGVGCMVAVGAPSSLAVQLAKEANLALFGFTDPDRAVRYS